MKTTISATNGFNFLLHYEIEGKEIKSEIECESKREAYAKCCDLLFSLISIKLDELYKELSSIKSHYFNNSLQLYIYSPSWTQSYYQFLSARQAFFEQSQPNKAVNEITSRYFSSVQPDQRLHNSKKCAALLADLSRTVKMFQDAQAKYQKSLN